jgi:hypothetical protein
MNTLACDCVLTGNLDVNTSDQTIILVLGDQAESRFFYLLPSFCLGCILKRLVTLSSLQVTDILNQLLIHCK